MLILWKCNSHWQDYFAFTICAGVFVLLCLTVVQICLEVFGQQDLLRGLNKVSLAEQSPAPFFPSITKGLSTGPIWSFWLADGVIIFFQIWLKHPCLPPPELFNPLVAHLTVRNTISITFATMVMQFCCSLSGSKFRTVCKDCQIGHLVSCIYNMFSWKC